jgi:hypothetical protein
LSSFEEKKDVYSSCPQQIDLLPTTNRLNLRSLARIRMPETIRPAFAGRGEPRIAYGVPFPEVTASQASTYFNASKVYVICSGSLSRNTDALDRLKTALGNKFAGVRIGMKPHTLWSEVVEIINDAKSVGADLLVTLGAGSLTDAAKIVSFVVPPCILENWRMNVLIW